MNSASFFHRRLCIDCLDNGFSSFSSFRPSWRGVSTTAAINKGLRATRDQDSIKNGRSLRRRRVNGPPSSSQEHWGKQAGTKIPYANTVGKERQRRQEYPTLRPESDFIPATANATRRRDTARRQNFPPRRSNSGFIVPARKYDVTSRDDYDEENDPPSSDGHAPRQTSKDRKVHRQYGAKSGEEESNDEVEQTEKGLQVPKQVAKLVKNASKLIERLHESQMAGGDTKEPIQFLNRQIRDLNEHAATGNSSEAIALLLQKEVHQGLFVKEKPPSDTPHSILYQARDGRFGLEIGSGEPFHIPPKHDRVELEKPVQPRRSLPEKSNYVANKYDLNVPIPYTKAASQFIYGHNAVLAALKARRRHLYKLYIQPKAFQLESKNSPIATLKPNHRLTQEFVALAKEANVPFTNEANTHLLDRMAEGRPHNGIILEASNFPAPPVLSLGKPNLHDSTVPLTLGDQSVEAATVNGKPRTLPISTQTWRYPLVVFLDGITDPGNVGNILRTCHFYGVDAVAVATGTCAKLSSAVLAKASAGACEAIPIFDIKQPSNFIFESAKIRWKIFAAVAPPSPPPSPSSSSSSLNKSKPHRTTAAESPLAKNPCILMLGAEGEGLRENLLKRANETVSIERGSKVDGTPDVGVDSVNVATAAGILLESFLRKPAKAPETLEMPAAWSVW